jgi:hypothetical protein
MKVRIPGTPGSFTGARDMALHPIKMAATTNKKRRRKSFQVIFF